MDQRLAGIIYLSSTHEKNTLIIPESLSKEISLIKDIWSEAKLADNFDLIELHKATGTTIFRYSGEYFDNSKSGSVFFLFKGRLSITRIKKTLKKYNLQCKHCYIIAPSLMNPRWFLPIDKALIRQCGNIVKPSKLRSIIAWKIFQFLNLLGLGYMLFSVRLVIAQRFCHEGLLRQYLITLLKRSDFNFIIYTGAYGCFQKFTIQIMDNTGCIIAYAKIGHTEQTKNRILFERQILAYLDKISFTNLQVPKALHMGSLPNTGDLILMQSAPKECGHWASKLKKEHIDALIELFNKTSNNTKNGTELLKDLSTDLHNINCAALPGELSQVRIQLDYLISILKHELLDRDIPIGLSHCDFSPWNAYIKGNGVYVFDWETAKFKVPLWDIYNFIFHSELLIHSRNNHDLYTILTCKKAKYSQLITYYVLMTKNNCYYNVNVFLLIFLYDICIWYLSYLEFNLSDGFGEDPQVKRLIISALSIMADILHDRDSIMSHKSGG